MDFEELAGIWHNTDIGLDKSLQINKVLVKNLGIKKVKSGLYEIKLTAFIGIVVWIFFSFFLSRFVVHNFSDPRFFLPALILFLITLFSLIIQVYKLTLIYTLDAASPVMEARKKLLRMKKLEIFDTWSLYLIIPLFFAPFMIVMTKAFLQLNLYTLAATWLIYATLGSIVIAAIIIFFLRKYPDRKLRESIAFMNELSDGDE